MICLKPSACAEGAGRSSRLTAKAAWIAAVAAFGVVIADTAHANAVLSGLSFTRTDSNDFAGASGGNVSSGSGQWGIFLASGTYSASPNYYNTNTTSGLSVDLSAGSYTFFATFVAGNEYGATNIWFDGNAAPGISVFSGTASSIGNPASFSAENATGQELYNTPNGNQPVTGSGSLTYDNGTSTVTLTAYELNSVSDVLSAGVPLIDFISSSGSQAPQGLRFSLNVTNDAPVPEPASAALLGAGVMVLGLGRGRKARRTG